MSTRRELLGCSLYLFLVYFISRFFQKVFLVAKLRKNKISHWSLVIGTNDSGVMTCLSPNKLTKKLTRLSLLACIGSSAEVSYPVSIFIKF